MSIPDNDAAETAWETNAGRAYEPELPDPSDLIPLSGDPIRKKPHDFIRELEAIIHNHQRQDGAA